MKRCPECGQFSEDDASFCPRCGCNLPDTPNDPQYGAYSPPPRRRNGNRSIAIMVGAVAVAAMLLAVGISMIDMSGRDSGYKDKTLTYSWKVPTIDDSPTFSVSIVISADEMRTADSSTIGRSGSSTNVSDHSRNIYGVWEYVVASDTVVSLSSRLWEEYKTRIIDRAEYADYDHPSYFADYVLAFVQTAAEYAYDSEKFGQDEYWQYPIETLYRGYGDCEDTSILASAIYSCLSKLDGAKDRISGSSVLLLPGHAMVGVDVGGGLSEAASFKIVVGSSQHFVGETTIDDLEDYTKSNWWSVGKLNDKYQGASVLAFQGTSSNYV